MTDERKQTTEGVVYGRRQSDKNIEVEFGGVAMKLRNTWIALFLTVAPMIGGGLWAGFELWKNYQDMSEKLANLEPEAIQAQIDQAMIKLDESLGYAKDIKNDLRSDVIQVERAVSRAEKQMRTLENDTRSQIREAQKWFDDRTATVDGKIQSMEERVNKKIERALTNALAEEQ